MPANQKCPRFYLAPRFSNEKDNIIFRTIFRTVPGNLKKCPESLLSEMVSLYHGSSYHMPRTKVYLKVVNVTPKVVSRDVTMSPD